MIEERAGGAAAPPSKESEESKESAAVPNLRAQYLWSPAGSDALVYRDRDTNADGTLDERLYAQRDAQGDVTAVVDASGAVAERYAYDAYGSAKAYGATWVERTGGTQVGWRYLHQGLRFDAADGLYDNRARVYSPGLMRFLQNDPEGFAAGDPNTYRAYGNGPTDGTDPGGMQDPRQRSMAQTLAEGLAYDVGRPTTVAMMGGGVNWSNQFQLGYMSPMESSLGFQAAKGALSLNRCAWAATFCGRERRGPPTA